MTKHAAFAKRSLSSHINNDSTLDLKNDILTSTPKRARVLSTITVCYFLVSHNIAYIIYFLEHS